MKGYETTQDLPGLTYDPELIRKGDRVIDGKRYDELVKQEQQADLYRAQTEAAVANQRSELLVPLEQATTLKTRTRTVSVQQVSQPTTT